MEHLLWILKSRDALKDIKILNVVSADKKYVITLKGYNTHQTVHDIVYRNHSSEKGVMLWAAEVAASRKIWDLREVLRKERQMSMMGLSRKQGDESTTENSPWEWAMCLDLRMWHWDNSAGVRSIRPDFESRESIAVYRLEPMLILD